MICICLRNKTVIVTDLNIHELLFEFKFEKSLQPEFLSIIIIFKNKATTGDEIMQLHKGMKKELHLMGEKLKLCGEIILEEHNKILFIWRSSFFRVSMYSNLDSRIQSHFFEDVMNMAFYSIN
jgi:hypothetical protein